MRARSALPVNAVDRPELCDFYTPAIVNRAPVAVAIGTAARPGARATGPRPDRGDAAAGARRAGALADSFRAAAERLLPKGSRAGASGPPSFPERPPGRSMPAARRERRAAAGQLLAEPARPPGHVWLVGAGPGAADLLTLRAQRVLQEADVIVHDALVPEAVVAMGRRDAERARCRQAQGRHPSRQDEINALLVAQARAGKRVVRLKSGDPLVFGRAGEEMAALRDAGISFEVVPGVTVGLRRRRRGRDSR